MMKAAILASMMFAQALVRFEFSTEARVSQIIAGRNVMVVCQGPRSSQLCGVSAYLMELPTGVRPNCTTATPMLMWGTPPATVEVCVGGMWRRVVLQ